MQADPSTEKWEPYKAWGRTLVGKRDTVITFNYDTLIEKLNMHLASTTGSPFSVIDPAAAKVFRGLHDNENACRVLKLHGSVDWSCTTDPRTRQRIYKQMVDEFYAVDTNDEELAIGTPGPTKQETVDGLNGLWSWAEDEVRSADAIVIVGYSFPQTDSVARRRLFEAIRANERQNLIVHLVVGQDARNRDRLQSLLTFALRGAGRLDGTRNDHHRGYRILPHPLFGEDFFTVAHREQILDPVM